jgi:DNA-binding transcriptional LysR family regulator
LRVDLIEQGWQGIEHRLVADGGAMAVLPVLRSSQSQALHCQLLWRERFLVVVGGEHELIGLRGPVPVDRLPRYPLVFCRGPAEGGSDVLGLLGAQQAGTQPRVIVDTPQTVLSMARAGTGVGILNAVAVRALDTSGLTVLEIDGDAVRDVAAYWHESLLRSEAGRRLHRAVLEAAVPPGGQPLVAGPRQAPGAPW